MSLPRTLFVGRGRLQFPLAPWLARKWDAVAEVLDLRVLNAGTGPGDPRFRLLPPSTAGFYSRLVPAVASELSGFRPAVVIASDPYVGAAVLAARRIARSSAKLIVEVHGDPATFTRLYGSRARRLFSPAADSVAQLALARADATRALSPFTSSLVAAVRGEPATACFPTYSDLGAFADRPPVPVPQDRRVVFIGALEPYKNIAGLAAAWRRVARELPDATLAIVGKGSRRAVVDQLRAELPGQTEHYPELAPPEVAAQIDASRALILPSWPEGLGRVVLESFARGRTAVATGAGGILDIVTDGRDGILIPPGDTEALGEGMLRILRDHGLAVRLGAAARVAYEPWHQTPEDFARAYRDLVARVLAGAS